jgi:mono/diheme cytochrome c family protein
MFTRKGLLALPFSLAVAGSFGQPAGAQSPTYGVGRAPTADEIKAWDLAIAPDGRELPAGRGTAHTGKAVYERRCAACHGQTGTQATFGILVGGRGTLNTNAALKTVGSYWPHATTVWDYIRRAMPFQEPGSLTHDEVYEVTAYLLYLNGIIAEHDVIDARTLPQVIMPNRDGFIPDPRPTPR